MLLQESRLPRRKLELHVENRTMYSLNDAELNIYETHQKASMIELTFNAPVLASMIKGKKVMHLRDQDFDFYPGESVIMPSGEPMVIDFPEANLDNPTQCLALTISEDNIQKTVQQLNEVAPRLDEHPEWSFTDHNFHFTNDVAVNQIIARLIWIFTENHPSRNLFAEMMLKELVIRLMQTEARTLLFDPQTTLHNHSRLAFIVEFIRQNLQTPLTVEQLSKKACMSQTHFFRSFKNETGISPIDFINVERIKLAKNMLANPAKSVTDVCYASGFNNLSYFTKIFKRATNLTPSEYRQKMVH